MLQERLFCTGKTTDATLWEGEEKVLCFMLEENKLNLYVAVLPASHICASIFMRALARLSSSLPATLRLACCPLARAVVNRAWPGVRVARAS